MPKNSITNKTFTLKTIIKYSYRDHLNQTIISTMTTSINSFLKTYQIKNNTYLTNYAK